MTFKVTIILSMFKNLYSELILKSTICNQVVEKNHVSTRHYEKNWNEHHVVSV